MQTWNHFIVFRSWSYWKPCSDMKNMKLRFNLQRTTECEQLKNCVNNSTQLDTFLNFGNYTYNCQKLYNCLTSTRKSNLNINVISSNRELNSSIRFSRIDEISKWMFTLHRISNHWLVWIWLPSETPDIETKEDIVRNHFPDWELAASAVKLSKGWNRFTNF